MSRTDATRRPRPSMSEVAAAAGVSKGAVSKVIRNAYGVSPAMRVKVESAIAELGYRPSIAARSMRGASFTIGLEIPQLGNDFFTQVIQGAAAALADSGFQLIIAPGQGEMRGAPVLNALIDRQVDGVIAISPEVEPGWLEELGANIPIVLLGRHDPSANYDTVVNDDAAGTVHVMNHLFSLGHTRIAHTSVEGATEVPEDLLPHTIRRRGYTSAMMHRQLRPQVVIGGPLEPDGYRAAMDLLVVADRPTAIFAANDTLAIGAIRARAQLGLSASEVSIVGYDNIDLAENPLISLTTIDQFGSESGVVAVRLLLERVRESRTTAVHHVVVPELRIRDSARALT